MIDHTEFTNLQQFVKDLNNQMALMQEKLEQQTISQQRLLGTTSIDSGDTAWVLTCIVYILYYKWHVIMNTLLININIYVLLLHVASFLVLFMTIPGLVLFYVGMVRTKNVLTTVMQVIHVSNNYIKRTTTILIYSQLDLY